MINGMALRKTTVTINREDLQYATRLTGARSASEAIRIALRELIRSRQLRQDIAAYRGTPATEEEVAWAAAESAGEDLADDTDWEALYADQ